MSILIASGSKDNLRLSVSKVKTFVQCKKQFEFSYILKIPKEDKDYHIFGKFCHKVLEDFYNSYISGSLNPFNIEMGLAYKNALLEFGKQMTKDMKKECWDIINKYLKLITQDKKNNKLSNVIACEKNFNFNISDNIILNGMIDRIQVDVDNVIHVADYKTTKNKKYLKDDWFQLLTYAYVMLNEDPSIKKIRASYILLRHDFEYITTEFNISEILSIKDKYIQYAQDIINEKEYTPNPSVLCKFCDYMSICDAGKKISEPHKVFGEVNW